VRGRVGLQVLAQLPGELLEVIHGCHSSFGRVCGK
jgi:hypothetical protein